MNSGAWRPSAWAVGKGCALIVGMSCFALAIFNTAWVSDDAYITFRVVENLIDGDGLVWNLGQRVQVFTHPLWMLFLSACTFVIGDPYWASLSLGILCSIACAVLVARLAPDRITAAIALVVLALSRIFVDFSTSGLENPLAHVLVIGLLWVNRRSLQGTAARDLAHTVLLASLAAITRLDLVLIGLPFVIAIAWRARADGWRRLASSALVGSLPAIAWYGFALLYYGTPLPNTYFAKLAMAIDPADLKQQGLRYLEHTWAFDPWSMSAIALGTGAGLLVARCRGPALGVLVYCAYVVGIGGDFMAGRFFSVPFVLAIGFVLEAMYEWRRAWLPLSLLSSVFLLNLPVTILSPVTYDDTAVGTDGIADERGFYYPFMGMKLNLAAPVRDDFLFARLGKAARDTRATVIETCNVGMFGYHAPSTALIVDGYGLTDPLLARLPAMRPWRIGHFERPSPPGYLETLAGIGHGLEDPALERVRQDLFLASSGPLFSADRLGAMSRLNGTGWRDEIASSPWVSDASAFEKESGMSCRGWLRQAFFITVQADGPQALRREIFSCGRDPAFSRPTIGHADACP